MLDDYKDNSFYQLVNNLTNFSHAYLLEVNSLQESLPIVKAFAKKVLCINHYTNNNQCQDCNICYQIDHDCYDDLYIINPPDGNIRKDDISRLLEYFKTKSLRENGKRVYVICGIEKLDPLLSNKLLKFIEEPEDNICGILMTENSNAILTTIRSRCQCLSVKTVKGNYNEELIKKALDFFNLIIKNQYEALVTTVSFRNEITSTSNREQLWQCFDIIEIELMNELKRRTNNEKKEFLIIGMEQIIKYIAITENIKTIIRGAANLNLLIDRYIIEITRGEVCKEL